MPAPYRVTIFTTFASDGASETYYSKQESPSAFAGDLNQMLIFRAAMMFSQQQFAGVRISSYGQRRSSQLILPAGGIFNESGTFVNIPRQGSYTPGFTNDTPDQFRAALQAKLSFGTQGRQSNRYIAGIPDALSGYEPATINFATGAAWLNAFKAWASYMVNNSWQVQAQQLPPQVTALLPIGVVQQSAAPGLLGIQVKVGGSSFSAVSQGDKIAVQGFRPAKGSRGATINGTFQVASVDTTGLPAFVTIYLRNSAAISPSQVNWTQQSFLRPIVNALFPITNIGWYRVLTHKRGRPSLAPRGRRLTRYTLDP